MTDRALRIRLAAALRRRVAPNTALQIKQLADAVGKHRDTVENWMHMTSSPSLDTLGDLIRFFASLNDHSFIREVFGPEIIPIGTRADALEIGMAVADVLRARDVAA